MDLWTLFSAILSVLLLATTFLTARWALLGFKQSKQALVEVASYVGAIVSALSPRIENLERVARQLRDALAVQSTKSANLDASYVTLQSKSDALTKSVEELTVQFNAISKDLEQFKSRLATSPPASRMSLPQSRTALPEGAAVQRLTPTERQTLEILTEGPLAAPELGRRLNKSREHMARLMKRLYMEGYVDRDADHPPFQYKLNDKLRSSLGDPVNAPPTEKT